MMLSQGEPNVNDEVARGFRVQGFRVQDKWQEEASVNSNGTPEHVSMPSLFCGWSWHNVDEWLVMEHWMSC
jgi:hypothetical protein